MPKLGAIRYLSMKDPHHDLRDAWLQGTFKGAKRFAFVDLETAPLSLAEQDYETLIIGGNDQVRAARFLKLNKVILDQKVKIFLMYGSLALRRAKALNAGFDDVFDCARTSPAEAQARCTAIVARYRKAAELARIEQEQALALEQVAYTHLLGKRERQMLVLLTERLDHPVSYFKLRTSLGRGHEDMSYNYLKVLASNVRTKLKPPFALVPCQSNSYKITRIPE